MERILEFVLMERKLKGRKLKEIKVYKNPPDHNEKIIQIKKSELIFLRFQWLITEHAFPSGTRIESRIKIRNPGISSSRIIEIRSLESPIEVRSVETGCWSGVIRGGGEGGSCVACLTDQKSLEWNRKRFFIHFSLLFQDRKISSPY